jgi:hypothetical protein
MTKTTPIFFPLVWAYFTGDADPLDALARVPTR